jgi:MtN3 and saliva related transmembrane protein
MLSPELLGYIAGTCTTLAFLPQVLKTYRTKSAKDVSVTMFIVYTIGILLWITFGIINHFTSIIVSNAVSLVLSSSQIVLKIYYDNGHR